MKLPNPTKKKRVSKRNKISWRKHVNINDVEEYLEDQRLEERLGPPLETLKDEELFKIETKITKPLPSRKLKKLKLLAPPKCFSILEPHTKVPDPITKRNRVRSKDERKNELIKKKELERRVKGILRFREKQAIEDKEKNRKRKEEVPKRGEFNKDVWNEESNGAEKNEWFSTRVVKHNLVVGDGGMSIKTVPKPKKTTILPSIELPHPGMSYNPSFEDHQDLLATIVEKEQQIIKEEKHIARVTSNMFSKVTADKRDTMRLNEMSEGLNQQASTAEDSETDDEYKSINPPVKNAKKTLQQRRKQKEQMKLELKKRAVKVEKKKRSDMHKLTVIKKQIEKNEDKTTILREKRKKQQALKKLLPKRLSAMKFEENELEFNIGPDISGNLRNMKKEGSILSDRFKSLQKRNIIEPSIRRTKKKSKVKRYTKPSHKD